MEEISALWQGAPNGIVCWGKGSLIRYQRMIKRYRIIDRDIDLDKGR